MGRRSAAAAQEPIDGGQAGPGSFTAARGKGIDPLTGLNLMPRAAGHQQQQEEVTCFPCLLVPRCICITQSMHHTDRILSENNSVCMYYSWMIQRGKRVEGYRVVGKTYCLNGAYLSGFSWSLSRFRRVQSTRIRCLQTFSSNFHLRLAIRS